MGKRFLIFNLSDLENIKRLHYNKDYNFCPPTTALKPSVSHFHHNKDKNISDWQGLPVALLKEKVDCYLIKKSSIM